MGRPKQLLSIDGELLLVHSIKLAIQSGMKTIVVLGANEKEHRAAIGKLPVQIVENMRWETGMGSSLKTGLKYLLQVDPGIEAIIVMVCDQPLLTTAHLKNLNQLYDESGKLVVASHYSGTAGVPALFHKSLFSEILSLSDEQGAKKIIQSHQNETVTVDFPDGAIDLDTPEDFRKFIS